MTFEKEDEAITLTLGDRLNFPYILANQIQTFQRAIVKDSPSEDEILESAQGLYELIPDAWREIDQKFIEEMKQAEKVFKVDMRASWCGVKVGEIKYSLVKKLDSKRLFHACINLLQRRGMLARVLYQEVATGKEFIKEDKE